jgi:CRISPR/Cas system-associated endoribonuclease Cas2
VDLVGLKSRLHDVINLEQHQILFIPVCERCAPTIEAWGRTIEAHEAREIVFVS